MIFQTRPPSYRAHRTTILINDDDWAFCKAKGFKPTNLLRSKIKELRKRDAGESVDWEKAAGKLRGNFERMVEVLQKTLTPEQFKKIMQTY